LRYPSECPCCFGRHPLILRSYALALRGLRLPLILQSLTEHPAVGLDDRLLFGDLLSQLFIFSDFFLELHSQSLLFCVLD
jgi:hypothetical protein